MRLAQKKIEKKFTNHDALIRVNVLAYKLKEGHNFIEDYSKVREELQNMEKWELKDQDIYKFIHQVQECLLLMDQSWESVILITKSLQLVGLRQMEVRVHLLYLLSMQEKYITKMEKYQTLAEAIRLLDYLFRNQNQSHYFSHKKEHFIEQCCLEFCKIATQQKEFHRILQRGIKILKHRIRKDNFYFNRQIFLSLNENTQSFFSSQLSQIKKQNCLKPVKVASKTSNVMNRRRIKNMSKMEERKKIGSYLKLMQFYVLGKKKTDSNDKRIQYDGDLRMMISLVKQIKNQEIIRQQINKILNTEEYFIPLPDQKQLVKQKRVGETIEFKRKKSFQIKKQKKTVLGEDITKNRQKRFSSHMHNKMKINKQNENKCIEIHEQTQKNCGQRSAAIFTENNKNIKAKQSDKRIQNNQRVAFNQKKSGFFKSEIKQNEKQCCRNMPNKEEPQKNDKKEQQSYKNLQNQELSLDTHICKIVKQTREQISAELVEKYGKNYVEDDQFQSSTNQIINEAISQDKQDMGQHLSEMENQGKLGIERKEKQDIQREQIKFEEAKQEYWDLEQQVNKVRQEIIEQVLGKVKQQEGSILDEQSDEGQLVCDSVLSMDSNQFSLADIWQTQNKRKQGQQTDRINSINHISPNDRSETSIIQNGPQLSANKQETLLFNITVIDPQNSSTIDQKFNLLNHFQPNPSVSHLNSTPSIQMPSHSSHNHLFFSIHIPQYLPQIPTSHHHNTSVLISRNKQLTNKVLINFYLCDSVVELGERKFYSLNILARICQQNQESECLMDFPYHCLQTIVDIKEKIAEEQNYYLVEQDQSFYLESKTQERLMEKLDKGRRLMVIGLWTKLKSSLVLLQNTKVQINIVCQLYEKLNQNKTIDLLIRLVSSKNKHQKESSKKSSQLTFISSHHRNSFYPFPVIHFEKIEAKKAKKLEDNLEVIVGLKICVSEKGEIKVNETYSQQQILAFV